MAITRRSNKARSLIIGETLLGVNYPVVFDPFFPLQNDFAPVTLITGSPGSGKTFFTSILAAYANILKVFSFIIDYKGDFISLKRLEQQNILRDVKIWNVLDGNEVSIDNYGALDPTSFTDDINENASITFDIIKTLVGDSVESHKATIMPILRDITEKPTASFLDVPKMLLRNTDKDIRGIGDSLRTYLDSPLGKLLTTYPKIEKKNIAETKGTVVINLMGLQLPTDNSDTSKHTASEKMSMIIMSLMTQLVLRHMRAIPKNIPKLLIIDEAWSVVSTPMGKGMVEQVGRLGRSLNMASILSSQSPRHFEKSKTSDQKSEGAELEETISTRFAFRNTSRADCITTIRGMNLDDEETWAKIIHEDLQKGQAFMKDCLGGIGVVQILAMDGWHDLLDTNPIASKEKGERN